jgi:general stress protein YciG
MKNHLLALSTMRLAQKTRTIGLKNMLHLRSSRCDVINTRAIINQSRQKINWSNQLLSGKSETDNLLYKVSAPLKKKSGFAAMSKERLKQICQKGGTISGESRREEREFIQIRKRLGI